MVQDTADVRFAADVRHLPLLIVQDWHAALAAFRTQRTHHLLYPVHESHLALSQPCDVSQSEACALVRVE